MTRRLRSRPRPPAARFPALPMLDVYLPMMRSAAILAAGQLGLFQCLGRGAQGLPQLARGLRVDREALHHLLLALREAGYVQSSAQARWRNTAHTARWFTAAGRVDYSAGLVWTAEAWQIMAELADVVRRGGPERRLWDRMHDRPELGARFSSYMRAFAEHASPQIARHVVLPRQAPRVLDIGGSHGLHSMTLCKKYRNLRATILDDAAALTDTPRLAAAQGLGGRIDCLPGDCRTTPLPKGLDAVLLYGVAHNHTAAENRRLFRRIAAALRPHGQLIVHDYVPGGMPETYRTLFDLTLLTEVGTRTHALAEFQTWATAAGFGPFAVHHLDPAEMGTVLVARLRARRVQSRNGEKSVSRSK